jgi:hypothetical protein
MVTPTGMNATGEELLEAVFSMQSVLWLYITTTSCNQS